MQSIAITEFEPLTESNMNTGENKVNSIVKAQAAAKAAKEGNHDPFKRINDLPKEEYDTVVSLLKGYSPYAVARTIQQDWGQCLDVTETTLAHQLDKFRSAKIPPEQLLNPYVISKLTAQVRRNVNVIAEMSSLVELQQERLRQARLQEMESGTLLPAVDKQTGLLARLLKNYGDLAYKTGLVNHFVSDFKKMAGDEEDEFIFSLEKLFFSYFRSIALEDPEGTKETFTKYLSCLGSTPVNSGKVEHSEIPAAINCTPPAES